MKYIALLIAFACFFQYSASAIGIEAGYFYSPSFESTVLSLQSDYYSANYSFGATYNINMSGKDCGLESAVVRYLEYDNGVCGIRYAPIEGMSFGYGLLLSDVNTLYYQPAFLRNEQCGLRVYYDFNNFVVEGVGTYSHLYGIRLKDISIFNMDLGLEYLSDAGNLSSEAFGRSAYGAYIEIPLTDEFSIFGESASASNGGEGNMVGASFDYDLIIAYSQINIGAISFNDRFIPGYFTSGYDINPIDFSSHRGSLKEASRDICCLQHRNPWIHDAQCHKRELYRWRGRDIRQLFIYPI